MKYAQLKPNHIQQDKSDGCSAASFLVILNSLRSSELALTQSAFRDYLQEKNNSWYRGVKGRRIGIGPSSFRAYSERALREFGIESKVNYYRRGEVTYSSFRADLIQSNNDLKTFLIFNYIAHYSPLGKFEAETNKLKILDVDWNENYSKEFHYAEGKGEDNRDAKKFYSSSLRAYLKIVIA
jgi:hypothetical protein